MILVDKRIKQFVSKGFLIAENFNPDNLKGIAYELTLESICKNHSELAEYELLPGETIFIRTKETLFIPNDITGRVIERNSVMRAGLKVDAPQYIPGHKTKAFLRVQNISDSVFLLKSGFAIAQIMFEQLTEEPEQTYTKQPTAAFADETDFKGLGNYQTEYSKLTKRFADVKDDIESLKDKIYANVLTLMGIFVAIFTLVSVNIQAFAVEKITPSLIAKINVSLGFVIFMLFGLIMLFINKQKSRAFTVFYSVLAVLFLVATLLIGLR